MTRFLEATRERFLVAIAASLPAERFIELHFFSPIRQAGVESGIAVIAAHPERVEEIVVADLALGDGEQRTEDGELFPVADAPSPVDRPPSTVPCPPSTVPRPPSTVPCPPSPVPRYTVYTAKYKLALKGPDRGKWECTVVAEADAPLVTVETVVRGVLRRSGDAEEPERMPGDDARDYLLAAAR